MERTIIKFGDIEIQKQKLHLNKIVVSNKVSFGKEGFKYFIGYKDAKIRFLLKMNAYKKDFDKTKYVFFDKK